MSNLRIIDYNAANIATLEASSEAGGLVSSNLLTDIKSQVWRSTATSATITTSCQTPKTVKAVIFAHTNFTNSATMRVRGYTLEADVPGVATPVFDTTALTCCAYTSASVFGWDNNVPGVANFGYGGGVYAGLFFTGGSVRKLYIEIVDTGNAAGYIEAARLITGDYWYPKYNANYGVQISYEDKSAHDRNDAGDLLTDIRPRSKWLSFGLTGMEATDRQNVMRLLRSNGISSPIFISIFPSDTDKNLEQDYMIYGKQAALSQISMPFYAGYETSIRIDEI